jgi:hypothetical protein
MKKVYGIGLIVLVIMAIIVGTAPILKAHYSLPTQGFSTENDGTIGAWYDESWAAKEVFQTNYQTGATTMNFAKISADSGLTFSFPHKNPTLVSNGSKKASLPSKTVVTRWVVSGHVHFPN